MQNHTEYDLTELLAINGHTDIAALRRLRPAYQQIIAQRNRALPYPEFLRTRYWQQVCDAVHFLRCYHCERCEQRGSLQVHHTTYEHHGLEHLYLADLILLCPQHHMATHGIVWSPVQTAIAAALRSFHDAHPIAA